MKQGEMKVSAALLGLGLALTAGTARADQVFADDVIVQGSICVGFDCVNGESFSFDTIRLKENNTRIKFEDTSTGSFPSNDWTVVANDSASGGANYLAFEDVTGGRFPFKVEAGAVTNALFVDSTSRVGLRTSTPVLDLHIATSNTPGMRLEQNSAGGFTAQTWDIAANETNFFVRDVTSGSRLPFRIRPGAPTSSIDIAANGNVGVGTGSPRTNLHVATTAVGGVGNTVDDVGHFLVENTNGTTAVRTMAALRNNGDIGFNFLNTATNTVWKLALLNGKLTMLSPVGPGNELELDTSGNLSITGSYKSAGTTLNVPDYVFEADYKLPSLSEVSSFIAENQHLPGIPSAADIKADGLDHTQMQLALLKKVEELTLYTLQQQAEIDALRAAQQ